MISGESSQGNNQYIGKCSNMVSKCDLLCKKLYILIDKELVILDKHIINKHLDTSWTYDILYSIRKDERKRDGIDFITYICKGCVSRKYGDTNQVILSATSSEFMYIDICYLDFLRNLYRKCISVNERYRILSYNVLDAIVPVTLKDSEV